MRPISRRALLRGAAAAPISAQLVTEDLKLRMAGLGVGGLRGEAIEAEAGGGARREFTNFAKWFKEVGEASIKKQAKYITVLDPDIIEMRSPSLSAKMRMQEKRNYARLLAEKKDWFTRLVSLRGVVRVWN